MVLEEHSMDTLDCQKMTNRWVLEQIKPKHHWRQKNEAVLVLAHHEKAGFFGKDNSVGKVEVAGKEDQI